MDVNKIKNGIEQLSSIGILPLIATLPFFFGKPQLISLYIAATFYLLDLFVNKRWKEFSWSKNKIAYILFVALFLMIPLRALFDDYHSRQLSTCVDRYLPFLIFGLIGIIGFAKKIQIKYVAWTMQLVVLYIFIKVLYITCGLDYEGFDEWIKLFTYIQHIKINSHMVVNMYLNFTLIISAYTLLHINLSKTLQYTTLLCMIIIVFLIIVSNGRAGVIGLLLNSFILISYYLLKKNKKHFAYFAIIYSIIAIGVIANKDKFHSPSMSDNPRLHIWSLCTDMIKERPIWGYGICSARKEFVERGLNSEDFYSHYAIEIVTDAKLKNKEPDFNVMHPHNAFLEVWMQVGILGVLLLIATLFSITQLKLGIKQLYLNLCLLAFLVQMMFESFGSHLQPLYLCLMVIIFHYSTKEEKTLAKWNK